MRTDEDRARHAAYMREWRATHPSSGRASQRAWEARNRDKTRERLAQYRRDHPDRVAISKRGWIEKSGASAAHSAVARAIRKGTLIRPNHCHSCLTPCVPEAHHPDYSNHLAVVWMCRQCHAKVETE